MTRSATAPGRLPHTKRINLLAGVKFTIDFRLADSVAQLIICNLEIRERLTAAEPDRGDELLAYVLRIHDELDRALARLTD